ncbi:MAG: hypothetical protein K2L02_00650 [Clostridia bacterium]|nr:hypothetical protein [Clostridia bacterium]
MARGERKGFVARWLEGKERSEDYARSTLPTNRWGLFWDIMKGRFGRMVITNLLVFITLIPVILILVFRWIVVGSQGLVGPFGGGFGAGYPALPNISGAAEEMIFGTDLLFYGLLIPAMVIAGLGISGGMYIIRNMIWTEGIFVANDFLRGIKRNFWNVLEAVLIFSVLLFFAKTMGNLADWLVVRGVPNSGWLVASKVIGYIFVALAILICLWMISLGVNYKQGPWQLFRNAVVMTFGTFPQTVFFAALALWPIILALFTSGVVMIVALVLILFIALSYAMLVWMDYCQWAFDKFINPNMGVATGRGLYDKNKTGKDAQKDGNMESAAMREYKRQIVAMGKSKLVCRPIKPIDDDLEIYQLPESFSREDLQKLRESKQKVVDDVEAYEAEHKDDEQYVEYNKQFEEQEKALKTEEDAKKKKKVKRPEMLNKKRR